MTLPVLDSPLPLCFAHRGGALLWPENTVEAFRGAVQLGIDRIETDVHLSRDGVIVVHHDERLERTTDGNGRVADRSFEELKRLDAGYRFSPDGRQHPWRGKGLTIPSFEEVLDAFPDVRFNVDLKQADPPMVRPFWELVERKKLHDRVLVAAADDDVVQQFRSVSRGRVATSAGRQEVLRFWLAVRARAHRLLSLPYEALQVPPSQGPLTVVDDRFVEAAHDHGLQVHVWTIDDPGQMWRLLELGADGLMSDRPDLLVDTVRLWHKAQHPPASRAT